MSLWFNLGFNIYTKTPIVVKHTIYIGRYTFANSTTHQTLLEQQQINLHSKTRVYVINHVTILSLIWKAFLLVTPFGDYVGW